MRTLTASEHRGAGAVLGILILSLCAASNSRGDGRGGTFVLNGAQVEFARLASDATVASKDFLVDDATVVDFKIATLLDGVITSITGPGGQVLNEQTIGNFGGEYCGFEGEAQPTGYLFTMFNEPGFHHIYTFPSLGAGTYTVRLEAGSAPPTDKAVLIELRTDSLVRAALLATESVLVQGAFGVLVSAVYEGTTPVTGATVNVWLKPPTGNAVTVGLLDNGEQADHAVGDGLYSGLFEATEVGEYIAVADITGLTSGGTPFARKASASVMVVAPSAAFTGAPFTDQGVDTNGNGKFERLEISAPVTVTTAGDYIFTAVLETALGKEIQAYGYTTLGTGLQAALLGRGQGEG